jgi:hypothetical protein
MEEPKPKNHQEAVAVFRHGVIGALTQAELEAGKLRAALDELSEKRFVPPKSKTAGTFSVPTLERWSARHRGPLTPPSVTCRRSARSAGARELRATDEPPTSQGSAARTRDKLWVGQRARDPLGTLLGGSWPGARAFQRRHAASAKLAGVTSCCVEVDATSPVPRRAPSAREDSPRR